MKIGYARTSTNDQNQDLQLNALEKEGCDKIFTDQISGSLSKHDRKGLQELFEFARKDDIIIVWKLDRLGRSLKDLISLVNELDQKGVKFKSITENIDTSTNSGKLFFHIMASLAEFERNIIRERTKAGLKAARARGRKGGRPTVMTEKNIRLAKQLHSDPQNSIADILKILGVKRATFYKMLKFE